MHRLAHGRRDGLRDLGLKGGHRDQRTGDCSRAARRSQRNSEITFRHRGRVSDGPSGPSGRSLAFSLYGRAPDRNSVRVETRRTADLTPNRRTTDDWPTVLGMTRGGSNAAMNATVVDACGRGRLRPRRLIQLGWLRRIAVEATPRTARRLASHLRRSSLSTFPSQLSTARVHPSVARHGAGGGFDFPTFCRATTSSTPPPTRSPSPAMMRIGKGIFFKTKRINSPPTMRAVASSRRVFLCRDRRAIRWGSSVLTERRSQVGSSAFRRKV